MAGENEIFEQSDLNVVVKSIQGALLQFYRSVRNDIKLCCPAIIMDYDPSKRIAKVIPLAKYAYRNERGEVEYIDRDPVKVHIIQPTYYLDTIDWQYFKGDTGVLFVCDNDISWMKKDKNHFDLNYSSQFIYGFTDSTHRTFTEDDYTKMCHSANTAVVHNYDSCFFFPISWTDYKLDQVKDCIDDEDFYLKTEDKTDFKIYLGTSVSDTGEKTYSELPSCHLGLRNGKDNQRSTVLFATSDPDKNKTNAKLQNDRLVIRQRAGVCHTDLELKTEEDKFSKEYKCEFDLSLEGDGYHTEVQVGDKCEGFKLEEKTGSGYLVQFRNLEFKVKQSFDYLWFNAKQAEVFSGKSFNIKADSSISMAIKNIKMEMSGGNVAVRIPGSINVHKLNVNAGENTTINSRSLDISTTEHGSVSFWAGTKTKEEGGGQGSRLDSKLNCPGFCRCTKVHDE